MVATSAGLPGIFTLELTPGDAAPMPGSEAFVVATQPLVAQFSSASRSSCSVRQNGLIRTSHRPRITRVITTAAMYQTQPYPEPEDPWPVLLMEIADGSSRFTPVVATSTRTSSL